MENIREVRKFWVKITHKLNKVTNSLFHITRFRKCSKLSKYIHLQNITAINSSNNSLI